MPEYSANTTERTGNQWKLTATNNRRRIEDALVGIKRESLADEVHVSQGQLSKMINGELARFSDICGLLGLTIVPVDYIKSMECVLHEKMKP